MTNCRASVSAPNAFGVHKNALQFGLSSSFVIRLCTSRPRSGNGSLQALRAQNVVGRAAGNYRLAALCCTELAKPAWVFKFELNDGDTAPQFHGPHD